METYKGKWIDYEGCPLECTDEEWEQNEKRMLSQTKGNKNYIVFSGSKEEVTLGMKEFEMFNQLSPKMFKRWQKDILREKQNVGTAS